MVLKKFSFQLLAIMISFSAWSATPPANPPGPPVKDVSGGGTSGGGTSVVCFNSKDAYDQVMKVLKSNKGLPLDQQTDALDGEIGAIVPPVRLYDLAEHENREGAVLVQPKSTWQITLESRIEAIGVKSTFSQALRKAKDRMATGGEYMDQSGVLALDDVENQTAPGRNCALIQVARQRRTAANVVEVHYDKRLLALMPVLDRAALDLHERIVLLAADAQLNGPVVAQDLVGNIFDQSFDGEAQNNFHEHLRDLGFVDRELYLQASGTAFAGGVFGSVYENWKTNVIGIQPLMVYSKSVAFDSSSGATFYQNVTEGQIPGFNVIHEGEDVLDAKPLEPFTVAIQGTTYSFGIGDMWVRNSGTVAYGTLAQNDPLAQQYYGVGFSKAGQLNLFKLKQPMAVEGNSFGEYDEVIFGSDGLLVEASSPKGHPVSSNDIAFKCYSTIEFYPSGKIKDCYNVSDNDQDSMVTFHGGKIAGPFEFYDGGGISKATAGESILTPGSLNYIQGHLCTSHRSPFTALSFDVEFYPSGNLKSCYAGNDLQYFPDEDSSAKGTLAECYGSNGTGSYSVVVTRDTGVTATLWKRNDTAFTPVETFQSIDAVYSKDKVAPFVVFSDSASGGKVFTLNVNLAKVDAQGNNPGSAAIDGKSGKLKFKNLSCKKR